VLSNGPVRPVNGANQVPCLVLLALGARLLPQGFELRDPFEVLILVEDAAAGRLYTMRAGEEIRHWRLSRLLPEYCNRRIGTRLLRELQSEAAAAGKLRLRASRYGGQAAAHSRRALQSRASPLRAAGVQADRRQRSICSWSGGTTTPNDPTIQGKPFERTG
jgi:hypothetical protein